MASTHKSHRLLLIRGKRKTAPLVKLTRAGTTVDGGPDATAQKEMGRCKPAAMLGLRNGSRWEGTGRCASDCRGCCWKRELEERGGLKGGGMEGAAREGVCMAGLGQVSKGLMSIRWAVSSVRHTL